MNSILVGVFGISGVGKSTLIDLFVKVHQEWIALSASEIIATDLSASPEAFRVAEKAEILENQDAIARAIELRKQSFPGRFFLLDAHAVVEGDTQITEISVDTVKGIGVSGFIVVVDTPIAIAERRLNDRERSRPNKDIEWVGRLQLRTTEICSRFARTLNLPYFEIFADDFAGFEKALYAIARGGGNGK